LFFKSNIKLRIILVYLSSTNMTKRTNIQNTIINWLLQAKQQNLYSIILDDFNTQDNTFSSSSKCKLINFLHSSNMFDIEAHFNNIHYTWSNNISSNNSYTSTSSDHLILTISWTFPNAYSKPQRLHTGISHRIFNYKATSTDQ
ncbi:16923_t:CDS:2, partial [Gigaspora margarita]